MNRVFEYIKSNIPTQFNTDISSIPFCFWFYNNRLNTLCLGVQLPRTINQSSILYWNNNGVSLGYSVYLTELGSMLKGKKPLMIDTKKLVAFLPLSKVTNGREILQYFEPIFYNDDSDEVMWYPTEKTRNLMKDVFKASKKLEDYDFWISLLPKYKTKKV